jgi:hypothetical protein
VENPFYIFDMNNDHTVKCPTCGTLIDVQDILAHKLEEEIRQQYDSRLLEVQQKLELEQEQLNRAKLDFEQKKRKENELFNERLEAKLKEESRSLEEKIKIRIQEEQSEQQKALVRELEEKSKQIIELNRTKAEIEILRMEKAELKEKVEAEAQRKLNEALSAEKEKIRKTEEERNEMRFRELLKQLEDQKKLTEEMKRKQEQGSMQLQGEVQELAIEEWLRVKFPLDTIEEIKAGARGGDCLQIVHTHSQQNCGKIYYESKRTKEFHSTWIDKLKSDMMEKDADLGVLVTEAMPPGFDRMGIIEGVWVCSYHEFKGLCTVLRENIIRLSAAIRSQENKGDKMNLLYDYLTGNTFRMQVEAIVEGFSAMKNALESEKRAMQRIWKEREKQIEKVISNTVDMYGSVRGIAGSAVQEVKALELPGAEYDDEPEQL